MSLLFKILVIYLKNESMTIVYAAMANVLIILSIFALIINF